MVATSGSGASPKAVVLTQTRSGLGRVRHLGPARGRSLPRSLARLHPAQPCRWPRRRHPLAVTGTPLVVHDAFRRRCRASCRGAANGVTLVSLVPTALAGSTPSLFRLVLLGGAAPPEALASERRHHLRDDRDLRRARLRRRRRSTGSRSQSTTARGPRGERRRRRRSGFRRRDPRERADAPARVPRRHRPEARSAGGCRPATPGRIDEQGRLHVAGRIAETINTGGEKVWPAVRRAGDRQCIRGVAEVAVCRQARSRVGRAGRRLRGARDRRSASRRLDDPMTRCR